MPNLSEQPYTPQLENLNEPSIFKEGAKTSFYDELFLEWIYLYEPRFYFHKDKVVCFFIKDSKSFVTSVALSRTNYDIARAIKLCIHNVTTDSFCFETDKAS